MHRTKKMTVVTTGLALLMAAGMSSAGVEQQPPPRKGDDLSPHRFGQEPLRQDHHLGERSSRAHRPRGPPAEERPRGPDPDANGKCPTGTTPNPNPEDPHGHEDCDASSGSGDSTQSQHGLVKVGNINLGLNNLLGNAFCQSNVGNGLAIAGIGDALAGDVGSDSGDGDCDASSISGDSSQDQDGGVNVGNLNLGGNNLLANAFCQSNVLNGPAVAGIGYAEGGYVGSASGDGDCSAESFPGGSDQDQDFGVNVGNLNLGGDNLLANAFCRSDVLNGLAVLLVGPAIGVPPSGAGSSLAALSGSSVAALAGCSPGSRPTSRS